jgi:hypothetical protein
MSPLNSIWVHIKWAPLNVSKIDQIPGRKYENRNGKNENPKTDLILLGNSRLMIIQVVCFHFMIATSQSSPPLMYLDGDDEVERLLDVSYTFTVWNVYINQQNCK